MKGAKMAKPNIKELDLASGFFSDSSEQNSGKIVAPKIESVKEPTEKKKTSTVKTSSADKKKTPSLKTSSADKKKSSDGKKKIGRPTVENKKKQYSLTMHPDLYTKLMEKAKEERTSFSQLITNIALDYLNQH